MKRLDGYLSKKVQEVWADSCVYECIIYGQPDSAEWTLEGARETIHLGRTFHDARNAIRALCHAERAKANLSEGKA